MPSAERSRELISFSDLALPRLAFSSQHFHARRDLLIRLSGSFAVLSLVSFFFIPVIRAQKLSRRDPPSGGMRQGDRPDSCFLFLINP
jgi:hypothetical protein